MTLLTLSNIYRCQSDLTIGWDRNDESLLRGDFGVLKTQGERIEGIDPNFYLQAGGTKPARHYDWV